MDNNAALSGFIYQGATFGKANYFRVGRSDEREQQRQAQEGQRQASPQTAGGRQDARGNAGSGRYKAEGRQDAAARRVVPGKISRLRAEWQAGWSAKMRIAGREALT